MIDIFGFLRMQDFEFSAFVKIILYGKNSLFAYRLFYNNERLSSKITFGRQVASESVLNFKRRFRNAKL